MSSRRLSLACMRLGVLLTFVVAINAGNDGADAIPHAIAFLGVNTYIVTTGNGTWGYSQYANNGHPNGNAAGQGDYDYPPNNLGFLFASQAQGLQTFSTSTAPANTVLSEMPVSIFQGIAAVAFPSKRLGVAVGSSATFHGSAAAGQFTAMTILVTVDGGLTWMRASGLPRLNQLNAPVNTNAWGTPQTAPPWPLETANDLTDVFFPSRTTGFAVGGNDVTLSSVVSTGETSVLSNPAAANTVPVAMGAVFVTTNGGTVWRNVPIFPSRATATSAWISNDKTTIKSIYAAKFPGILFGVSGTSNGKYLYAVGSPGSRYFLDAAKTEAIVDNSAAALSVKVDTNPTILFSSNGGVSWTAQTGPFRGGLRLTLFAVSVEKGSTAVACGGNPTINFGGGSNGAIILTTNGGFTWRQVFPLSNTAASTPTLTCVTHQPAIGGVSRVWVGGYVTTTDQARTVLGANIPKPDFFPTAAQVTDGFATPNVKGLIHTIILSLDNGNSFSPAPFQIFPSDFVQRSFANPQPVLTDWTVYGITWETPARGWIFGKGYILGTTNYGITWNYETPPDVASLQNPNVKTLVLVPTSH